LEIERDKFLEKIFEKTLEQIFIENRLYKKIENVSSYDKIHNVIETSLEPFHDKLSRVPNYDDRERLLNIPIRRISRFDLDKNLDDIKATRDELAAVEKHLKNIKKFTISYLRNLIAKYGKEYVRKTQFQSIGQIDMRAIETRTVKVGFDPASGFVGTKVTSDTAFECTNFDKILLIYKDGSYKVINIPEKQYVHQEGNKVVFAGIADKKTVFNVAYRDPKTHLCYAKRFIVEKFILDKLYRYIEEGMDLQYISTEPELTLELVFIPKPKQKVAKAQVDFAKIIVKGVTAKGIKMAHREVKKVLLVQRPKTAPAEAKDANPKK
jgi:topoisomerase IV subunit A